MTAFKKLLIVVSIFVYLMVAVYATIHLMSAYPDREISQLPGSYLFTQFCLWASLCFGFFTSAASLGNTMKFYWGLVPLIPIGILAFLLRHIP